MPRKTIKDIQALKKAGKPIVCLTAYTAPMATILDPHVDMLLVGDSVGMVLYGQKNTLGVTLDMMIAHTKAVMRASRNALVVMDLPYGTYEDSDDQAVENARRALDETGCHAVKIEGGTNMATRIAAMTKAKIPVMAHVGLLPQHYEKEGGFKIKGKTPEEVKTLIADAKAVEEAGAFSYVLEGTIESAARKVTAATEIPSIGIGATSACDGQVLVTQDMLGMSGGYVPKFAKVYEDLAPRIENVIKLFAEETRTRVFPDDAHTYK